MQDRTPWWAQLLRLGLWTAIIGGVLTLLIYLGVGPLIRRLLASLGMMIPAPTKSWAKLEAEGKHEEASAAMRTDPVANAAYKRAKKAQKEQS